MKNSMSPEPNLWFFRSLSLKKAYIDPNLSLTASRSRSSPPGCVCIPLSIAWSLVILQPLTRKTTLRRSSLTVVRRWKRSECEWLTLSPKFIVKQHRWREKSYVFDVGGSCVICSVRLLRRFRGWRMRRIDLSFRLQRIHKFGSGGTPFP